MYNDEEIEAIKQNVSTVFLRHREGATWQEDRLNALNLIDGLRLELRSLRDCVVRQEIRIAELTSGRNE